MSFKDFKEFEIEIIDNLPAMCKELLEWDNTGILIEGKVKDIARRLSKEHEIEYEVSLDVVESVIHREAMSFLSKVK